MRFNSIEITNYRQYKDLKFNFSKSSEYDLHIIIGTNGMGKTNILNAISWCLYGIEPHLGIESKALPIINTDSIKEAKESGEENQSAAVKIFTEDKDKLIIYQRKVLYNVNSGFLYREEFTVTATNPNGDATIYTDEQAKQYVNKYLPERIRQYFFFDGEQLDTYFVSEQSKEIKRSIHAISQVDIVSIINERLGKVIEKKQSEAGAKAPNINAINFEINETKKQKEISENERDEIERQLAKSEAIINQNTEKLRGAESIPELINEYEQLEKRQKELENNNSDIEKEIFSFITEYKAILTFYPFAKSTLNIIYEKESNNELPPTIDRIWLEDMLNADRCFICDRELNKEHKDKLLALLDKIKFSNETSHLLLSIKSELERIIKQGNEYLTIKDKLFSKKKYAETELKQIEQRMQVIDNIIIKSDKTQIQYLHNERNSHRKLKELNLQRLGVVKNQIDECKLRLAELETKLSSAIKKLDDCKRINELIEFLKDSKAIVEEIEKEMMDEVKVKMQLLTMQYFNQLVWKQYTFDRIELDDNYELDLFDVDGYSCLGSCSAAERSLLALSFTLALHQVSGFDSLLFIDTPVARVSDQNRVNFANVLREVSRDKQIIMAFTPSEYSSEIIDGVEAFASTTTKLRTNNERVTFVN